MAKSRDLYYVHIGNSHDLRKTILESSKLIIECLRRFETFKSVRAQRIKTAEDLMFVIREMNEMTMQMKIDIPKMKLPAIKGQNVAEIRKPDATSDEHNELKKLESAIAEIEERLSEID